MAAPSNPTGQPKYALGNSSSDGLRNVLFAHAASGHQVFPRISASDGLRIVLPAPAATTSAFDGVVNTSSAPAATTRAFDGLVNTPSAPASTTSAFDGVVNTPSAPASTSAESSSGMKHPPYDVFINHCGEDTKETIAKSIYKKLDATGLRVFLDKDELELGDFFPETLEEAMASASLHIALFSEHYAHSPWCLAELAFMLQTRVTFIPIFYHVEPSTLRWAIEGKGAYADAFKEHEMKGRYSLEKLRSWKLALQKASLYTGEIINNQSDDEEKAVTNVVNRVLKELEKDWLHVAKHPVGLDEAEQDFHDKIALQSAAGPVQIVGIYGMGGAGKTTLAKRLYNNKCSTIGKSSFVSDVREAAKNNGLHEKQQELLKDLGLESKDLKNVDRGMEILRSRLSSVCVLIVLDDVDHTDQLDALLPARESLGHGSLIIVTTRELSVLRGGVISTMYKMRTLNPAHAQQLFCWHAFGQPSPILGFEGLVKSFINACHGLPLSLKVTGGLLRGESSVNYWQSQLDKLCRIVPDDIKLRLKISYDALDKEEKEMFLDLACFFIGWTSSRAVAVWDGSGWNGLHGWQRLVNKCLVEVDEEKNLIRMHDHLRDLGREIANQQSPYRLWSKKQIIEIQPQQEAVRIRGISNAIGDNCYPRQSDIIINTNEGERSLSPVSLGLKIFVGKGDFINEERRGLSRELLCFQCAGFEHRNLPSWLSLKKLQILELYGPERLEDLWGCDADAPLQLRELAIRWLDSFHGLPRSIAHLKSLKKILINAKWKSYETLSHLPEEFCYLQALEHLEITWCKNLSYLPSNFGNLTNLQHLDLSYSTTLKMLPDSCKQLTLLEYLNLRYCYELTIKPESHIFENMTKIKYLDLHGCKKLEDLRLPKAVSLTKLDLRGTSLKGLPANIFQLTKLTELEIGSDFLTVLPTCHGNLSSLTTIKIQECKKLESLPDSLEHLNCLRDLHITGTGVKCLPKSLINLQCLEIRRTPISELSYGRGCMLKKITLEATKVSKISICGDCCPFLETLELSSNEDLRQLEILPATLKSLDVYKCKVLEDIRGVRGLKNLQKLCIRDCEEVDGLPNFAELESLETFELTGCSKVKKIAGLHELRSLQTLSIQLDELPNLAELTSLRKITLQKCDKREIIERLDHLRSLEELKISYCPELEALPSLAKVTSLKNIELRECAKLSIVCLKGPTSLEKLMIHNCPELDGLPGLAELTSLKVFKLEKCDNLKKVEGLESLQALDNLKIIDCPKLDGLPSLAELSSLKEFELGKCDKLKKVEGLESLQLLKNLKITFCPELDGLPSLEELTSLKKIELKKCGKLKKIGGLESLQSLDYLKVIGCPKLDGLPSLAELSSLKEFELGKCDKLKKVEGLESLQLLKNLKITFCPELDGLPSLAELTSLKKIELEKCGKLKKIGGLEGLQSLKNLKIIDCPKLDGLPSLAELSSLKKFELGKCDKLKKVEGLESLRSLETLSIDGCSESDTLPTLAKLTTLKTIELKSCNKLEKIESFKSLGSLKILKIYDCPVSDRLPSLGELISLETFELEWCHKLEKIEGLESLGSLKTLRINVCPKLDNLPSLAKLTSLNKFELTMCNKLEKIEGLESLRSLKKLKIDYCTELNILPSLIQLTFLKEIELKNCNKLEKIESLRGLKSLETLRIESCSALDTLPSLEESTSLKKFTLIKCHKLKKIEGLESLKSLEMLSIKDCSALDILPSLAESTSLKKFELIECHKLNKIGSLESLRSLEMLAIFDCPIMDTLPSLAELTSLEEFRLEKCNKLKKIEGLGQLTSLKELQVHTSSKGPCILDLEHHERLKSLVVVANDRPVVEPFINDTEKWPRELIVCTRAVIDVGSLENFFTSFPLKNVVEFGSFGGLNLRRQESSVNANAILICFIIDYVCPEILLEICTDKDDNFCTELANGKWVWMGVFPEGSDWLESERYEIRVYSEEKEVKVKEAWLLMGKERSIVESFHQLSQS